MISLSDHVFPVLMTDNECISVYWFIGFYVCSIKWVFHYCWSSKYSWVRKKLQLHLSFSVVFIECWDVKIYSFTKLMYSQVLNKLDLACPSLNYVLMTRKLKVFKHLPCSFMLIYYFKKLLVHLCECFVTFEELPFVIIVNNCHFMFSLETAAIQRMLSEQLLLHV